MCYVNFINFIAPRLSVFLCKSFLPFIDLGTFSSYLAVSRPFECSQYGGGSSGNRGNGMGNADLFVSFHKTTMSLASTSLSQQRQVFPAFNIGYTRTPRRTWAKNRAKHWKIELRKRGVRKKRETPASKIVSYGNLSSSHESLNEYVQICAEKLSIPNEN